MFYLLSNIVFPQAWGYYEESGYSHRTSGPASCDLGQDGTHKLLPAAKWMCCARAQGRLWESQASPFPTGPTSHSTADQWPLWAVQGLRWGTLDTQSMGVQEAHPNKTWPLSTMVQQCQPRPGMAATMPHLRLRKAHIPNSDSLCTCTQAPLGMVARRGVLDESWGARGQGNRELSICPGKIDKWQKEGGTIYEPRL